MATISKMEAISNPVDPPFSSTLISSGTTVAGMIVDGRNRVSIGFTVDLGNLVVSGATVSSGMGVVAGSSLFRGGNVLPG
jgi:hypothetical protein